MQILVAVLAHTRWIHTQLARQLIDMAKTDLKPDFLYVEAGMVDEARNFAVKQAIDEKYDYLMMIDHDNPCTKNPLELILYDKDIIFCPTPTMNRGALGYNVSPFKNQKPGLIKVHDAGTGCVLISRKALEGIPKPLFETKLDKDGLMEQGEDITFCQKARDAGFDLYSHTDFACHHYKECDLLDLPSR